VWPSTRTFRVLEAVLRLGLVGAAVLHVEDAVLVVVRVRAAVVIRVVVERVRIGRDLEAIVQAVTVGVGVARVGAELLLLIVGEAVAIRVDHAHGDGDGGRVGATVAVREGVRERRGAVEVGRGGDHHSARQRHRAARRRLGHRRHRQRLARVGSRRVVGQHGHLPTEARRSQLHIRPLAAPVPKRTLALIWRKRTSLRAALRQVAATIRTAYPKA
jgi:hypothetical protein